MPGPDNQHAARAQQAFDHAVARERHAAATHERAAVMHENAAASFEKAAYAQTDADRRDDLLRRAQHERELALVARDRAAMVRARLAAEHVPDTE